MSTNLAENTIQIGFEGVINGRFSAEEERILNENGLIVDQIDILDNVGGLILATFKKTEKYTDECRANLSNRMK